MVGPDATKVIFDPLIATNPSSIDPPLLRVPYHDCVPWLRNIGRGTTQSPGRDRLSCPLPGRDSPVQRRRLPYRRPRLQIPISFRDHGFSHS